MSAFHRIALVTGAASGIGAATARRLATRDVGLVLTTRRNEAGLSAVAVAAQAAGAMVETVVGDLTDPAMPERLVATAMDRFGRLDHLVSNAGRAAKGRFGDFSPADVTAAIELNALPFVALVTVALPALAQSPAGRVVAVSSFIVNDFGINGTLFPTTAAGKGALEALAKSLAFQVAAQGITVNCVAPGFTRKDGSDSALSQEGWDAAARATPSGRIATPDDVAAAIGFLLSGPAQHITGQILRVDGGLSLL